MLLGKQESGSRPKLYSMSIRSKSSLLVPTAPPRYATEVSPPGLRRFLDMVLTHGSLRDGNSLAEYIDHLNTTGEHGVIPHKKRAWRLALRALSGGDSTCVVHGSRCDCQSARSQLRVDTLTAVHSAYGPNQRPLASACGPRAGVVRGCTLGLYVCFADYSLEGCTGRLYR